MFVEKKIESVLRAEMITALAGVITSTVEVRTSLAEPAYSAGDEEFTLPMVVISSGSNGREMGQTSQRSVSVSIAFMTHFNDDYARNDLSAIYEAGRDMFETTTFDFSENIIYTANSYSITPGSQVEVDGTIQTIEFTAELMICANAFSWTE